MHDPTVDPDSGSPTTCWCCGRHAVGVGVGQPSRGDPHYLCEHCLPLIAQIKATTKFDEYERVAIEQAVEALGPLIDQFGPDLSEWNEQQATALVVEAILAFGTAIRQQVKDRSLPF